MEVGKTTEVCDEYYLIDLSNQARFSAGECGKIYEFNGYRLLDIAWSSTRTSSYA